MNKLQLIVILSVLFVIVSCNKKSHYAFDVKEIDFINKTGSVIDGNDLHIEIMRGENILICDSLLLITTGDPMGRLKVFSLNDYKLLNSLCIEGRAKNEFFHPTFLSDQWFYDKDGNIILPVIDNAQILKEINLSQSIKEQKTVVLPYVSDCLSIMRGNVVLIDNDNNKRFQYFRAHEDEVVSGKYCVPEYNITESEKIVKEIDVYPKIMSFVNEERSMSMYFGTLTKHPSKNIIIQPLQYMDYILRFDLDKNDFSAIHQIGSLSFDDIIPDWPEKSIVNFTSICYTPDYLFLLYKAGKYSKSFPDYNDAFPEVYVFDWDCNYLGGVKLGQEVHDIAYDEKNKKLIGLHRSDDIIYSFDLSSFMSSLKK